MSIKTVFLALLTFISLNAFSQFCYTDHSTVDNVEISYKWKEVKDGHTELRLKLKNRNPHAVNISLEADYYLSGILKESSSLENFCLKANKMVAGKFNGVIFTATGISNEDLKSEEFSLEFNNILVEELEDCPEKE